MSRKGRVWTPREVDLLLNDVIESASHLKKEIRWVHSVSYGENPGPKTDRVSSSSVSDPTGSLVVNQQHVRAHYRRAVALAEKARNLLVLSVEALQTAVDSADRSADWRDPTGTAQAITRPSVTKSELKEALERQRKRAAAGLGYGES